MRLYVRRDFVSDATRIVMNAIMRALIARVVWGVLVGPRCLCDWMSSLGARHGLGVALGFALEWERADALRAVLGHVRVEIGGGLGGGFHD